MKKIIFILEVLMISILPFCNKKEEEIYYIIEIENITIDQIYNQKENEYYIFFYKNDCQYCEAVKDYVITYSKNNQDIPIYGITYSDKNNLLIARSYDGEDGHGKNGVYMVDNIKDYSQLYIPKVPSLIKVTLNAGEKYSIYCGGGRSEVEEYFINILKVEI